MNPKTKTSPKTRRTTTSGVDVTDVPGIHDDGQGFDVTRIVGSVRFGGTSDLNPDQAAFLLIADQGPGEFTFPGVDGPVRIVVERGDAG